MRTHAAWARGNLNVYVNDEYPFFLDSSIQDCFGQPHFHSASLAKTI